MRTSDVNRDIFTGTLLAKLQAYVPAVQKWYDTYYEHVFDDVGTFAVESNETPPGLFCRFLANTKISSVSGMQAYLYVAMQYLDMPRCVGGVRQALADMFRSNKWFALTETISIKYKTALSNTNNGNPIVLMVPTYLLASIPQGGYRWITASEQVAVGLGVVPTSLQHRISHTAEVKGTLRETAKGIMQEDGVEGLDTLDENWFYSNIDRFLISVNHCTGNDIKPVMRGEALKAYRISRFHPEIARIEKADKVKNYVEWRESGESVTEYDDE